MSDMNAILSRAAGQSDPQAERLQDIIKFKDTDNALYGESWSIIDNKTLVISFEDDRPSWLENVLASVDDDGNTPQPDPVTAAYQAIINRLAAEAVTIATVNLTMEDLREIREVVKHLDAVAEALNKLRTLDPSLSVAQIDSGEASDGAKHAHDVKVHAVLRKAAGKPEPQEPSTLVKLGLMHVFEQDDANALIVATDGQRRLINAELFAIAKDTPELEWRAGLAEMRVTGSRSTLRVIQPDHRLDGVEPSLALVKGAVPDGVVKILAEAVKVRNGQLIHFA